jgi:hypothetical protein
MFSDATAVLQEFRTIGSSMVTVFNWLMGGVDLTVFSGTHNPQIGLVLLLLYWFTMSMVLLNCLIAIMADACSRVRSCSGSCLSSMGPLFWLLVELEMGSLVWIALELMK